MHLNNHPLTGVRTRRQILGVSGVEMAQRLGCTPTTYFRYERGERRAYLDQAKAIAAFLGCTTDELDREPTEDEQVELFKRSKARRSAQASGLDPNEEEELATLASAWIVDDDTAQ